MTDSTFQLRHYAALTAIGVALSACAAGPDSIAPTPMGGAFAATPCADARAMLAYERQTLATLSDAQRSAQADTLWEALFPTIMMGDDRAIRATWVNGAPLKTGA